MHSVVFSAFLATCLSGVMAVDGHAPSTDRCPGAKLKVVSLTFPQKALCRQYQHYPFFCDRSLSPAEILEPAGPTSILDARRSGLTARNQAECTEPSGEACERFRFTCSLYSCPLRRRNLHTDDVLSPHCIKNCNTNAIFMKIPGTNDAIGQTFIVDPGYYVLAFFSDCEFEWDNISKTPVEFAV